MEHRTDQFARHPLFAWIGDDAIPPEVRLTALARPLSHFVMSFADLYALVLRDPSCADPVQRWVDAHTFEDGGHWKWFLSDLDALGLAAPTSASDALRGLWSERTEQLRMVSYRVAQLGLGADPLQKLVVVLCVEATGKVTLSRVSPVGDRFAAQSGRRLVYFGGLHLDTESEHTLERPEVARDLARVEVTPERRAALVAVVDVVFDAFERGADDLLAAAG